MGPAQFHRLAEHDRPIVRFTIDDMPCEALAGDTVLTAVLTNGRRVRESEFTGEPLAGFCLMGACQDCLVTLADGERLRACSTFVTDGMRLVTRVDTNG
jgi:predicted molibdopterin-dependent oxidoreductase YjgC